MSETTLVRDAWLLGQEVLPNFEKAGLPPEVIAHYRAHKDQYIPALQRGFVLPNAIVPSAVPVEMAGYPIEETDYFKWVATMDAFARRYFGFLNTQLLSDMFATPPRLPWKKVLPIFDPGLTNREMVDKVLKARKLDVYEGTDVMKYTGAGAFPTPRLYIIERTPAPTLATMGLPPKYAKQWFGGRQTQPLGLRAYGIGTSVLHSVEKQFLDPEAKTATFFPENILPGGYVACGCCYPSYSRVLFCAGGSGDEYGDYGFREAIEVPLKTQPSVP